MSAHMWVVDSLIFAAPLVLITIVLPAYEPGLRGVLQIVFLVAMSASLVFRRSLPLVTGWIVVATGLLYALTFAFPHPALITVPITVHAVTAYAPRRWGKIFLGIGIVAAFIFAASNIAYFYVSGTRLSDFTAGELLFLVLAALVFPMVTVALAWTLGDIHWRKRDDAQRIAERNTLLERERENEIRLASDAERMRIAREMHDIVAHSMSVIITQADGGRYAAKASPQAAMTALETIAETGREALGNLRGMLGVLRDPSASAQTSPMPGIQDLGALVENVRAAGLEVTLSTAPDLPELAPAAQLAVYRIVQEALTNTMKHGGPDARAEVTVEPGELGIVARVVSTGRAESAAVPGSGAGIQGMKERAHIHGGSLVAEPTEAGFLVELSLPEDVA